MKDRKVNIQLDTDSQPRFKLRESFKGMEDLKSSRNRSVNKTITTDQVKLYRDSFLPSILKYASR